jgi:hypothetical protein
MMMNSIHSKLRQSVAIALCMIAVASLAHAATYYVSPTGNDSNNGTTQSTPWKTLAKVNAFALQPDDQVLFQRGGEWRESLQPTHGGTSGHQIVFDAYGTGNRPLLWGSDILISANFSAAGSSNYNYTTSGLPSGQIYCLCNNQFIGTGPAGYSGTTLTISSPTDPRTDGKLYTVCTRDNMIFNNFNDHIIFRNIVIDEAAGLMSAGNDQGYGIRIQSCTDVQVSDCEAYHCGRHHVGIINATGFVGTRIVAAYVAPAVTGGSTIFVSYADGTAPVGSCTSVYIDCKSFGGGASSFTTHGSNQGPVTFRNFQADSAMEFQKEGPAPVTVTMIGGLFTGDATLEGLGAPCSYDGLTFKDNAGIDAGSSTNAIQNCVFLTNPNSVYNRTCALNAGGGWIIRFNTFATPVVPGIQIGDPSSMQLYGNIFSGTGPGFSVSGTNFLRCDYNLYDYGETLLVSGNQRDFTWWKAQGMDVHGLQANPLFVNAAAGDYSLQIASMAVDGAQISPASILTFTNDIAGNIRPQGSWYDIGAYERAASGPMAPIISSPSAVCGSTLSAFSYQIVANAAPTNYSASGLPSGLTCNSSGLISGTASQAGTFSVTLNAVNSVGTGSMPLTLRMYSTANYPFYSTPLPIEGTIQIEDFDQGGEGAAYHDADGGNTGNANYRTGGMDIYTLPGGGYVVSSANGGQWAAYTVDVTANANYKLEVHYSNGTSDQGMHFEMDGVSIGNLTATGTGSWNVYNTVNIPSIALTAGTHVLKFFMDGGGVSYDWMKFTNLNPPTLSPHGVPYSWFTRYGLTAGAEANDPDNDGMQTWQEYYAGTDPTNKLSVFKIVEAGVFPGASNVWFKWYGTTNSGATNSFKIYRRTDMVNGSWQLIYSTATRSSNGTNAWTNDTSFGTGHYRVAIPNP